MQNRKSFLNTDFKIRDSEDSEEKYLEGYFIKFNEETNLFDNIYEEVDPQSITNSLENNDIRCLFNHQTDLVLGRTGNKTLELRADENGLFGKVKINKEDRQAMDILARIERGDINACSFGFNILNEEVVERADSVKFILKEIDLVEVSPVTFPAYPTTEISARNKDLKSYKERQLQVKKSKLKERLNNVKATND